MDAAHLQKVASVQHEAEFGQTYIGRFSSLVLIRCGDVVAKAQLGFNVKPSVSQSPIALSQAQLELEQRSLRRSASIWQGPADRLSGFEMVWPEARVQQEIELCSGSRRRDVL